MQLEKTGQAGFASLECGVACITVLTIEIMIMLDRSCLNVLVQKPEKGSGNRDECDSPRIAGQLRSGQEREPKPWEIKDREPGDQSPRMAGAARTVSFDANAKQPKDDH